MRILWVVNTVFPDAAIHLGEEPPIYGGWMYGLASDLADAGDTKLAVATVYPGKVPQSFSTNGIHYYLIPAENGTVRLKNSWRMITADLAPDLVHIHGTEFDHGLALMNACPNLTYLVSIQGLVSVYHRYYLAGMSVYDVLRSVTLRDIIRWNTLFHAKHDFYKRGIAEREYILRAKAVIGRTEWDYAHVQAINPSVEYFFCNESLRDEFYSSERWSLENCQRHCIFLSQASYPIKGLHQVLKAVALLKHDYSDIMVEVAGYDITGAATLKERLRRGGYGRYIDLMIRKYGLEKHVKFLGPLRAEEMKKAYLRSHVFICPSSIENSPNSLGEAQLLGVPCIAAYVGGVPSMVKDGKSAVLYRFEEHEMLAANIKKLFKSAEYTESISKDGYKAAHLRHHRQSNLKNLQSIYEALMNHPQN